MERSKMRLLSIAAVRAVTMAPTISSKATPKVRPDTPATPLETDGRAAMNAANKANGSAKMLCAILMSASMARVADGGVAIVECTGGF